MRLKKQVQPAAFPIQRSRMFCDRREIQACVAARGNMKKSFSVFALMIFSLTSCTLTTSQVPAPATTVPPGEITAADVILPFDGAAPATIMYMHCYINAGSRIHTTDIFYFNDFSSDETIHIFAPVGGLVMYMADGPYMIGENIIVKTDFVFQKERVYYQLTRFHEMNTRISVGDRINQGDIIGYIDNDGHPSDLLNGYILDIGFFVAKPDLFDNDAGNSANIEKYIDPGPLLIDGLKRDYMIFRMPGCKEDPVTSL